MKTIEQQIRTAWAKLRAHGLSPVETSDEIIAWAMNDDHPESTRARICGPTAAEIDRVLATLLRAESQGAAESIPA